MNLEHVRRLLLITTLLALPLLAGLWVLAPPWSYDAWGYPLLAVYLAWVAAALAWSHWPAVRIMSTSQVVLSIFWLGLLTYRLVTSSASAPLAERVTPDLYLVFVLLSIVAYTAFPLPVAVQASAGLLASTAVLAGGWSVWVLLEGRPFASVGALWAYEAVLGVTMLMVHILTRSKDRRAEALLDTARMAYTDPVTSLPTRRELEERLGRAVEAAEALVRPVSVVFFDIDDFKRVNDVHGHLVGDAVLTQVGDAVRDALRAEDQFGRWGGEEYLIVAPGATHEQAVQLAERIRGALASHKFTHGVRVTGSFGVATSTAGRNTEALLLAADQRLYQAKWAGKNRVVGKDETLAT